MGVSGFILTLTSLPVQIKSCTVLTVGTDRINEAVDIDGQRDKSKNRR